MKRLITRRRFILDLANVTGVILSSPDVFGLPFFRTENRAGVPQFFVVFTATGGMDCTLGLDPQVYLPGIDEKDIFIEYRPEDIVCAANDRIKLGPAAVSLAEFANEIVVFNGIDMNRDIGHTTRYITSGMGGYQRSSCSIDLASAVETGPFGVLSQGELHRDPRSGIIVSEIERVEKFDKGLFLEGVKISAFDFGPGSVIGSAQVGYLEMENIFPLFQEKVENVRQYGAKNSASAVIAGAFMSGAAKQAEVNLSLGMENTLDTHANHEKLHLIAQKGIWDRVAETFKLFKAIPFGEKSLFDATLFFCASEFSRTPALNSAAGKDHNIETNSVLLAGAGLQGGKTVGASRVIAGKGDISSRHMGVPIDFETGNEIDFPENPDLNRVGALQPSHIIRTIGRIYGDPEMYLRPGNLQNTPWIRAIVN